MKKSIFLTFHTVTGTSCPPSADIANGAWNCNKLDLGVEDGQEDYEGDCFGLNLNH